ncbi:MAG: DUF2798 domain-containing protein [Azospirillum sp.]|nr:DUF2798 domain-containing protein [Azospirillum sp.]
MSAQTKIRIAFSVLLTCLMTFMVSGVSTLRALGFAAETGVFLSSWLQAWLFSWAVAAPMIYVLAPWVRAKVEAMFAPKP